MIGKNYPSNNNIVLMGSIAATCTGCLSRHWDGFLLIILDMEDKLIMGLYTAR